MTITTIRNISQEELKQTILRLDDPSRGDILEALGIHQHDPRARKLLNEKINLWNLNPLVGTNRQNQYSDEDVRLAAKNSLCISDVLDKIGLTKHGDNFKTVRKLCNRLDIDISHFNADAARQTNTGKNSWTIKSIFTTNSSYSRGNLRKAVIKYNILPIYACSECNNNGKWNGEILKLQVDHINGINNDNRSENLRWLCPNCHSQTETFGT